MENHVKVEQVKKQVYGVCELGLLYYKQLCDAQDKFLRDAGASGYDLKHLNENDTQMVKYVQDNLGYFINYGHSFAAWIESGVGFHIGDVYDAVNAFARLSIRTQRTEGMCWTIDWLHRGLAGLGQTSQEKSAKASAIIWAIQEPPVNA